MKCLVIGFFIFISGSVFAQTKQDSITNLFKQIEIATADAKQLWDKDIYGPILLVNPFTRKAYANMPDSFGVLKPAGSLFSTTLPASVVLANASIKWSGYTWAMILEPFLLASDKDRVNLFCHELFHVAQPSLGFKLREANNNHIDTKNGRIYLRLELNALLNALNAASNKEIQKEITNALIFRKYRHALFSFSDSTENVLELNEGMAEYTGSQMSGRNDSEIKKYFNRKVEEFLKAGAFVRTFAYCTIPIYGYFLKKSKKFWNKDITRNTNLTSYIVQQLNITLPDNIEYSVLNIRDAYDYEKIFNEETEKEVKFKKLIAHYKAQFFDNPVLKIQFEKKKATFDAREVVTLEDKGIVYPTTTVVDNWGRLTVDKVGALLSADRNSMLITAPKKIEGSNLTGEGWTLTLDAAYEVIKEKSGNYIIQKKK